MDPITRWLASAAVGLILLAGTWFHGRHSGVEATRKAWDASIARGQAEVERLKGEAGKVTVRTETVYVEQVREVRVKGDTVVREVPVYVPAGSPDLPGGFRVFHDAAAAGSVPDPAAVPDAAPVDAQAVAATVAANYFTCHETREALIALQGWVAEQHALNPEQTP